MPKDGVSIERARAAKSRVQEHLPAKAVVNGVGLTRLGADYAVKVNLAEPLPAGSKLPKAIDGVPLVVEVVGALRKQPA